MSIRRIQAGCADRRLYDWDDQPIELAVWRCGGLTEAGKVLFDR
jgi:hypothetical protein